MLHSSLSCAAGCAACLCVYYSTVLTRCQYLTGTPPLFLQQLRPLYTGRFIARAMAASVNGLVHLPNTWDVLVSIYPISRKPSFFSKAMLASFSGSVKQINSFFGQRA